MIKNIDTDIAMSMSTIVDSKISISFQAVIGTYSNSTLELTKLSTTSSQLIFVILWEFLQLVLLTSLYLDATLRVGGSEEKEEEVSILIRF